MFEDWKKAWQEAVSNFQRELDEDDDPSTPAQIGAMRRDLQAARRALESLRITVTQTQTELAEEEKQEQQCRRRGELASGIGDEETVRIANEWAERHAQRAAILRQKAQVLAAELTMRTEDLRVMESQMTEAQSQMRLDQPPPAPPKPPESVRQKQDTVFRNLEREAKEKAAEARLEELKKKLQS